MMMTPEKLDKLSDAQLTQIVQAHERDMQKMRNARRAGIFLTREMSEGVADMARAILRRRKDDDKVKSIR